MMIRPKQRCDRQTKKKNFFTKKWLANLRRRFVVKLLRAVSNVLMVCSNSLQFHFEKYFTKKKSN